MRLDYVIAELQKIHERLGNVEVHTRWPTSLTRNETGVTLLAVTVSASKVLGDRGYDIVLIE
jgi:hypothetical protein